MVDNPLQGMDIPTDQAGVLVRFLEAYANTCIQDPESIDSVLGGEDSDDLDDVEKLEDQYLLADERFALEADAAVSLREAAQWCLYTDTSKSADLLRRAGERYWRMRQPFGLYLQAVGGAEVDLRKLQKATTAMILMTGENQPSWSATSPPLQQSVAHPQQQAYLMLTYGGLGAPALEDLTDPYQMMRASPHSSGVVPVGALGTPIHRLWTIAMHLTKGGEDAMEVIANHLGLMCQRYQETMRLAQTNTYLWENGVSPVEVGDIDIAGIAALVTLRFDDTELLRLMESLSFSGLFKDIGMAPVEAGIKLANEGAVH
ncbi:hypothetical protein [Kocuria rosea]|uniref:hypothetical protein n=1 Tax=Kocuria rosea TaxID=1275 RepID=UPI00301A4A81